MAAQKKSDEAIAAFRQAIALRHDFAEAYFALGIVLVNQRRYGEAIDAYRSVIGLRPDAPDMKGPHELYLPHAVGDGNRHRLHFCQAPGMTSLLEPDPAVLGLFHGFPEWGRILATQEIDTVRLDDIAETAGERLLRGEGFMFHRFHRR